MKYIIPILIFFLFSAMAHSQKSNDSFTQLWRQVEKLENEALTKSALKLVSQISEKAKRENNSPQIVKALLYTSKYIQILEEDAQLAIVENFESAIARSKFPMTNVLESYLANLYWQYFQQNRYRFYNRTMSATKVDSTDFRTWDLNTLFQEINIHFEKSLQQRSALGQVRVSDFDVLLTKQKNSEKYRPSLYDILAHTALKFYTSDENAITRPADKFEIRDPVLFSGAAAFAALDIDHHDGSSLQLKALKIYRDLVLFHLNDSNPEALAEVDLERLEYIYRNAVFDKKDLHYEAVLSSTAAQCKDHQVTALYKYQIARLYNEIANSYQAGIKQEHQWKRKDALELCQQLIQKYPKSRGAEKSRALKRSIEQKDLQLTIEQHLPLNTPSKLLVSYKNQDDLELFAYSLTKHQLQSLNEIYPIEKKLPFIKRLKLVKQWNAALKNEKDYQRHTTEILLPGLDNGLYIILAKPKDADQTFAFGHTQATDMALLESRTVNSHRFQLINRKDGTPVNNATLKLSYRENYARVVSDASYTTDPMGMVDIPLSGNTMTAIEVIATKDGENAHFGSYYIRRKPKSVTLHKVNYAAFLFTDRSIYRPGQPMYFKGIAIKKTDDLSSVSEDLKVDVILKDVNGQQLAMQQLITNEYGSFKGEIILPENGLPGNFRLEVTSKDVNLRGYTNISVEEYKRPKFETNFEPVTATYSVNDSIRLKGTATAYAGSNITDAQVVYRVKRVVYFPRWYYRYGSYFDSTPQEIAFGVTKTAADGSYEIVFKALPDDEASNEGLPVFSYEVTADVTDINGETRSTSTVVRVGYHTLIATVSLPDRLDKQAKGNTIKISSANLNG
ncbi:MAG: alpha-2-macroglobulin, partial [Eudoraea sp.]|nr:alpha-2-macroglobulin [Eudoraea sp.]